MIGLFLRFRRIDTRKIDPAFAVAAAAFFGSKVFIHHAAHVKHGCGKKEQYDDHLYIHVTKLIHFRYYIRKDNVNSIWFNRA